MLMKGRIRSLAGAALLTAAATGCAWIEPRIYDISDPLQSRELLSQCVYKPEKAEERRRYPLVVESSNWFFNKATIELYDSKGKRVAKARLPDFEAGGNSSSVTLENALLSPWGVLRVTNSERTQVDFYFDPEVISSILKKEDVIEFSEFVPFDLYSNIKEARAVLRIPAGIHAAAKITIGYLLKDDTVPECAKIAKSVMYFGGTAKRVK